MSIVKKLFPEYESKQEMKLRYEKELAFANGRNIGPSFLTVNRNVQRVRCTMTIAPDVPIPTEYLKKRLAQNLAEYLEPFIEYDLEDGPNVNYNGTKLLVASLYVAERRCHE